MAPELIILSAITWHNGTMHFSCSHIKLVCIELNNIDAFIVGVIESSILILHLFPFRHIAARQDHYECVV